MRLDSVEKANKEETIQLKEDLSALKKRNLELREENQLLRNDNTRLKSIINHDSSNTSAPPSSDSKGGKAANTYNGRKKQKINPAARKGIKGQHLPKRMQRKNQKRTIPPYVSGNWRSPKQEVPY